MKISAILFICILIHFSLSAQQKPANKDIRDLALDQDAADLKAKQDTINLIGVLFTCTGTPASNVIVFSQGTNTSNGNNRVYAVTNYDGLFVLKGIATNDMITISSTKYDELHYYNKGSRLMVIFLPPEKVNDLNSKNPIEITAKRITKKIVPTSEYVPVKTTTFYSVKQPQFDGGPQEFLKYISKKLKYPYKAIKNNIEGTVEVSFVVGKDGRLSNFLTLKGIGYDCDKELINILTESPAWRPAIMNGVPVTSTVSVSVKFSLTDN